jgi:diguanylate cyclase (GGDEF)-like protein
MLFVGTAIAAVPSAGPDDFGEMLRAADSAKTSNHAHFSTLIKQLNEESQKLNVEQQLYLHYLNAYQLGYGGQYESAIPILNDVIARSSDPVLKFRAGVTAVNILSFGRHYEEAFRRLSELLEKMPSISDKVARSQALGVASALYSDAGQYELAIDYANRFMQENPGVVGDCKGSYLKLEAAYRNPESMFSGQNYESGIDSCAKAGEPVFSNLIRSYAASIDINNGKVDAAIVSLQKNYMDAQHTKYPLLISVFNAFLGEAYWKKGDDAQAEKYALSAVQGSVKNEYTEPAVASYKILYQVARKQGNFGDALAYHEKYMAADKGYLNEISAKALAFQTVKQQVLAKKLQIDTLNKQNQILVLQQKLGKKAAETSRLYILLLLGVLVSIGFWSYRVKRSQLSFMKLARRDGLTGIFNRQHFVSEAELQLQYCKKSLRDASLILIDLDHFKMVNDTHGHAVGDRVLRRAVEVCKAQLRSTDIFGRLGGEEFGILLPECTLEQTAVRAEQIRAAIAEASISEEPPRVMVSASFGVASSVYSGYELRQLLIHADEALYQAKRDGRNRVNVNDNQNACLKMG